LASPPPKRSQAESGSKTDAPQSASAQGPSAQPAAAASSAANPAANPAQPAAVQERPKPELGTLEVRGRNAVGSSIRLLKVTYLLDGNVVATQSGDRLVHLQDVEAFKRQIEPGDHTLSIIAEYQGTGYGAFSYHKGFGYTQRSSQRFNVREKSATKVTVSMFEKGGVTTAMEKRLAISFKVSASGA
jgi:hypothetical protein